MAHTTCIRCSRPVASLVANELCETCRRLETERTYEPHQPGLTPFRMTGDADPDPAAPTQRITWVQPPPPVLPGYEIRETLGGGGMGVVYLAYEEDADRLVALKFVRAASDPGARERFRVEVQAMARLDHENVVRVFTVELDRPEPFFTMEYVNGPGLDCRILNSGPLPVTEAVTIMEQVARAIQHAHDKDVVHRDLKPGNIVVGSDGIPKVTDFGLAKRVNTADGLTVYDAVLGTPGFMAPEQTGGQNDTVSTPADIYGLGSTLYALLTGHPPFRGFDPVEVAVRVRTQPPRPPSELRSEVSAGLDAIILKCLAKDPAKRFASAGELADELGRVRRGERPLTPLPSRVVRLGRAIRRRRSAIMTSFVPFLALFVASGGTTAPAPDGQTPSSILELEQSQRNLVAGLKVDLIDKAGQLRHASWKLNGLPLHTSEEGYCVITPSRRQQLLQVYPAPSTDRYRIRFEFKQEGVIAPEAAGVGIYFGYNERATTDGIPVHSFYCVHINSFLPTQTASAGGKPEVQLDRRAIYPTLHPNDPAFLAQRCQTLITKTYSHDPEQAEPWRYVEVEVTPSNIRVLWRETPGSALVTLAQLDPTSIEDFVKSLNPNTRVRPKAQINFGPWHPQSPIGIYGLHSRILIRTAELEPLSK